MRRYAMLEKEELTTTVLILSGQIGKQAEKPLVLGPDVARCFKGSTDTTFRLELIDIGAVRTFRASTTEEATRWIDALSSACDGPKGEEKKEASNVSRSVVFLEENEKIEELKIEAPKTETPTISPPSTPGLRVALKKSLAEMRAAVFGAAADITSMESSSTRSSPTPRARSVIEVQESEGHAFHSQRLDRHPPVPIYENISSHSNTQDMPTLISLLFQKEEQIRQLQTNAKRHRRYFQALRQRERSEILKQLLRLKGMHGARMNQLRRENTVLQSSLSRSNQELDQCRRTLAATEDLVSQLTRRVRILEEARTTTESALTETLNVYDESRQKHARVPRRKKKTKKSTKKNSTSKKTSSSDLKMKRVQRRATRTTTTRRVRRLRQGTNHEVTHAMKENVTNQRSSARVGKKKIPIRRPRGTMGSVMRV